MSQFCPLSLIILRHSILCQWMDTPSLNWTNTPFYVSVLDLSDFHVIHDMFMRSCLSVSPYMFLLFPCYFFPSHFRHSHLSCPFVFLSAPHLSSISKIVWLCLATSMLPKTLRPTKDSLTSFGNLSCDWWSLFRPYIGILAPHQTWYAPYLPVQLSG